MAGRKPLGPALVEHLDGSTSAKERLELILATIAGKVTVVAAAEQLGISEAMFYKLRSRVLQVSLEDLEPKPIGRPAQRPSEEELQQALAGAGGGARARAGSTGHPTGIGTDLTSPTQVSPADPRKKNQSADVATADAPPASSETKAPVAPAETSRCQQHAAEQQPRREQERRVREAAVQFVDEQVPSCRRAAQTLQLCPRTLAAWRQRSKRSRLAAQVRGRPVREPLPEERSRSDGDAGRNGAGIRLADATDLLSYDTAMCSELPAAWLPATVPGKSSPSDRDSALEAPRCGVGHRP